MSTKDWLEKDYYSILGVPSSVDATTLKKTYRKLARAHHPDANKGDPASEARFKEVSEAYDVLSDPKTRAEYDQVRAYVASGGAPPGAGFGGGGPGFGGEGLRINLEDLLRNADGGEFRLSDLFGAAFGGGDFQDRGSAGFPGGDFGGGRFSGFGGGGRAPRARRGADTQAKVKLSFDEAWSGTTLQLRVNNQSVKAKVPAGVRNNALIKLKGKGQPGANGGPAGDLLITVEVEPDSVFARDGDDVRVNLPVRFDEAALGGEVVVPVPSGGTVTLKLPPNTQNGRTFRVRGKGAPKRAGGNGDLLATVEVAVPQKLSDSERKAIEDYASAAAKENPREQLLASAANRKRSEG
ncbi:MAG: J domain-containing protein [Actinobacteria bacterium]|nr:J domain-containing protein [Actinomycetota bacterium]